MAKKNILFISYDGMTDPLGQSQVIPYLAGLTKYGYCFTILSCEKPQRFALYKNDIEILLSSFSIKWEPVLYHKNPPVFSSVFDVIMLKRKAKFLHSAEKFDMVHTRAGIPSLIGLWMKKKLGVKFLHDVREFYADSRVDGGMWNLKNPFYKTIYKYFKRKEEEEVKRCDGMVCLTYAAEKIIKQWPECKEETILEVIPCSTDMALFDPEKIVQKEVALLRKELEIKEDDFIISYLGSIGGWYLTDEMMKFCKTISDIIPNARFLFITPHQHKIIREAAATFGIVTEKIIVKHGERNEIPLLLSLSNYSMFFIKACYSKKSSSPTKHGEIMAMGIPLITNEGVGDVAEIVERYHSGIVIKNMNDESYIYNAKKILNTHFNSKQIRNGAIEFYSLENAVRKYRKVYLTILSD
ncbi:MAG: glycosyltransferase [Bacteroidota bacterium]|nr:glycosyltransferase [Bacteroidota bacterium]